MALTYKQKYVLFLITIALAMAYLIGVFDFITGFQLEVMPLISVRNFIGFALFYMAKQSYNNQVDYY